MLARRLPVEVLPEPFGPTTLMRFPSFNVSFDAISELICYFSAKLYRRKLRRIAEWGVYDDTT